MKKHKSIQINSLLTLVLIVLFSTLSGLSKSNEGLIAHYPFNGNANDESGNDNNGIVSGATLTTDRFGN